MLTKPWAYVRYVGRGSQNIVEVTTVRVTILEGTPEELKNAGILDEVLTSRQDAIPRTQARPRDTLQAESRPAVDGLPQHVGDMLEKHAPGGLVAEAFQTFLKDILSWGDVEARRGRSTQWDDGMTDYTRVHRRGSRFGAFVYVYPRHRLLVFRLPVSAANGLRYASVRDVKAEDAYKVRMLLPAPDAVAEAISLARQAYEDALAAE